MALPTYLRFITTLIVILLLTGTTSLPAQLLNYPRASEWLRPADKTVQPDSSTTFIGNHAVMDLDSSGVQKTFQKIGGHKTGTFFMVARMTAPPPDSILMRLGPIRLYPAKAVLGGHPIEIPRLTREPVILRFMYQGRPGRRSRSQELQRVKDLKIAEVIFYDELLEKKEARIVESYLAMKYSINITQNKNPRLRDYLDIFKNKAWNAETDARFDEEVLALGRLDRIAFYQSHTFTADSQKIHLSLAPDATLGQKPRVAMADSSLLLLSKKQTAGKGTVGECGAALSSRTWKLNFVNWQSGAPYAFITLDTLLPRKNKVYLRNGGQSKPLEMVSRGGQTTITVPLPDSATTQPQYLVWRPEGNECTPLCQAEIPACGNTDTASLQLRTDPRGLPAHLRLVNLRTEAELDTVIRQPHGTVQNLQPGPYQLHVENEDMELLDRVLALENCRQEKGPGRAASLADSSKKSEKVLQYEESSSPQNSKDSSRGGDSPGDIPLDNLLTRGIQVFPNPAENSKDVHFQFRGLNDRAFRIEVFDSKGNLLSRKHFTPQTGKRTFTHHFRKEGAYMVRFISGSYSANKQTIIH